MEATMTWLQRRAWWLLMTISILIAVIGLWPVNLGIKEDASVPLGISGMTAMEIEASSPQAYRLVDFQARSSGIDLIVIGTLLSVVALVGYRREQPWAWWVMWILPVWAGAVFVLTLAVGVAPGEAPPTPMISGSIIAILTAAILVISAPRMVRRRSP
jgi:hypothetical protein